MKRATRHDKKMRWIGENEAMLEAQYPGKWVAIADSGLASVGASVLDAEMKARESGFHDIVVIP